MFKKIYIYIYQQQSKQAITYIYIYINNQNKQLHTFVCTDYIYYLLREIRYYGKI